MVMLKSSVCVYVCYEPNISFSLLSIDSGFKNHKSGVQLIDGTRAMVTFG